MWTYLAVLALSFSVEAKYYTDCGSKLAVINGMSVSDCSETATECILKRNTNATITIVFTPTHDIKSIQTAVHGMIMNLPVPFPLPQPDACKDSGLSCPLKSGDVVTYKATLPVLKSYPKVKVDVKWELKNHNDEDLVCILIPARIQ